MENIFPLEEGLLIEFHVKRELKFADLLKLKYQSKFTNLEHPEDDKLYSYATLNKHPYNSLKIMGSIRERGSHTSPWFRTYERIAYVSNKFPLLISYNTK